MKKIIILLGVIQLTSAIANGQQRDTTRHKESDHHRMNRFIRQRLNIDSVKAEQIAVIQDTYKASMKQLMSNGGLTENQKRHAMDSLVNRKNNSLSALLTPEQQAKFIPSTERAKSNATEKKKQ